MTEPKPLQQIDRTYVRFKNRKLSYFSGCDYFRMASEPAVLDAVRAALKNFGLNVAASRLTTGNHILYPKLEKALAGFFGSETALLTGGGYLTNLVVCQTLAGEFSHALIDEHSHPSLCDAARFLDCPILKFKHLDLSDFEKSVKRCGPGAKILVLTDGHYSGNGSAAPLKGYLELLPRDGMILVDDAHGAGVLGKTGKGAVEHAGVSRQRVIQTITLSKAFGVYGGAIICTRAFRTAIIDRSGAFIGHTALPLPLVNAALTSIKMLKSDRTRRARLNSNAALVKNALKGTKYELPALPGPIVPIYPKSPAETKRLHAALLRAGIFPPFLRYPGASATGYFRFVISSEHTPAQLKALADVLRAYASS